MDKVRKDIKWDQLNDKKLTKFLTDLGIPKTGYRVLVWDIENNLIGAVKRSGDLYIFNDNETRRVLDALNQKDKK